MSELVERVISYARVEADETFVFEHVRGCNRKKEKRVVRLSLKSDTVAFLADAAARYVHARHPPFILTEPWV